MRKIRKKKKNKGKFTAWARSHGMTVQEAANRILRNRRRYSPTLIKRANFVRNAAKWEDGGELLLGNDNGGGFMDALGNVGKALGPIGSILNAGTNIFSMIQQGQEKDRLANIAEQNRIKEGANQADMAQTDIVNNYPAVFKSGGQFKGKRFGFKPGEQNAEVEDDELIITPDGVITGIKGNRHKDKGGGEQVQLPNSSKILSRKYAKNLLPYSNKMNKEQEILQGNSTRLAKTSADKNYKKYYSKIMSAYNNQEADKIINGEDSDQNIYQGGGLHNTSDWYAGAGLNYGKNNYNIPQYLDPNTGGYSGGGVNPGINNFGGGNWWNNRRQQEQVPYRGTPDFRSPEQAGYGNGIGMNPTNTFQKAGQPMYTSNITAGNIGGMNEHLQSLMPQFGSTKTEIGQFNSVSNDLAPGPQMPKPSGEGDGKLGGFLEGLGTLAPSLYNLGQGLFGEREYMDASRYQNPYESKINSLMADRTYNIDPDLAANEATFRTTAANMRNLGGSRGQVMANLTGAQNVKQFGDMSAYAQKKNMENQYRAEYANALYPMGRDTAMTRMAVDEGNQLTDATGRGMIASGMTGVQQYLLTKRQMKNQNRRGDLLIDAIKGYGSGRAGEWIPGLDEFYSNYYKNRKNVS